MDLSLEFHHPLKSKLSNNPQTNEDLVGKNTDNDEKVTVLDKLEHESNKVTIKGQFIEGSGAIATRDFGIDVTTSVHSSNDFGNITFSNTNIIHHKKGNNFIDMNDNKMFLGDGVEIVPHDFVKNFIENMNSRMNATTTTTSEPSSTDLQKKEAINSPVKTTTEASTEHPLEVTTVATKTSDTTTVISVQTTQNTITTTYSDGVTEKNNDQSTSTVSTESNVTVGFTTAKSHTPTSHETTEIHTSQVTTAASHTPTSRKTTKIPSSQLTTNTQTTSIISSEIPLTDSTYTLTTKLTTRFINTAETSEQNTAANLEQTSPVVITERPTTEPGGPTTEPGDSANEDDSLDLEQDMPNNGTISDIKDVDTIIFPSFRADIRKRRRERKKFCFRIGVTPQFVGPPVIPPHTFGHQPVSPDSIRKFIDAMKGEIDKMKRIGESLPTTQKRTLTSTTSPTDIIPNEDKTASVAMPPSEQTTPIQFTTTVGFHNSKPTEDKLDITSQKPTETKIVTTEGPVRDSTEKQPDPTTRTPDIPSGTSAVHTYSQTATTSSTTTTDDPDESVSDGSSTINIDKLIFPSHLGDKKTRKKDIRQYCNSVDFGDIKKSVQCCKKTLNCFDDLPENLDETVFHQGTHDYNEAERLHVCSHIDESIKCKQSVEIKPQCNKAAAVLDKEIKPQMDKIKLFYYNHCNRGTPISPTVNPDPPTLSPRPPTNQDGGSEHYHSNSSNFAPFIGGAVIGVFGLIVIILIALYCRKRMKKSKRRKEQAGEQDRESSQSSRYKTVTYERRRSEVYAEIDEKNMITSVSYDVEGHNCSKQSLCSSGKSRKHAPSTRQEELDNHGYLSPQSIFSEDCLKPDVIPNETNIFTHGYIELKSESGDSAQSYAKLGVEPEDEYVSPDQIQGSPNKDRKSDKLHTYFVLEKENE